MRRLIDFLTPLGVLLALGVFAWSRAGRELPGGLRPWLIGAAALALVHLVLRWEDVASAFSGRSAKYGANTALVVALVLGILGGLNWMATRYFKRFDLTKGRRYSLSDQTQKVVNGLKDEVKITYLAPERELTRGQERLKEYLAISDKLKVEFVDPRKKPAVAQAYDARGPWPILIVEKGGSREKVTNDGEQDITNALIKVTRESKKTVCFAEGEGERDIDASSEQGYSGAKTSLEKSLYGVKKVLLLRENTIPSDCTVFVVGGPEKDLAPAITSTLREFVKAGGKLLVLSSAPMKGDAANLSALLKEWNIEAGQDVVVDVSVTGQLAGSSEFAPTVIQYPFHDITKDFARDRRVVTAFPVARSMQAGTASVEGVAAQNLLETSQDSWAESDLALKGRVQFEEGKDRKGPISLAAVATVRGKAPEPAPSPAPSPAADGAAEEPPKAPEGRVVAIGSADFASNGWLGFYGNQDLFLNVVSWLAQDPDLISIRPKDQDDQRMFLSAGQKQNVTLVALLLLPGLFVVLGVATWWRRR
jgi:ABC-type uncharacterized transport system involved in gliding motility auxiliary subunit